MKKFRTPKTNSEQIGSYYCRDKKIIKAFVDDEQNPFLISFPRTGSHWLRMVMELYFEKPSLKRIFYYPESQDYLTLHTHDLELDIARANVIYLYRNPIDTIYSQLKYYGEDMSSEERVYYWSNLYGRHLDKWLFKESFTNTKTILSYDGLKIDFVTEFEKICRHFNQNLSAERLKKIQALVTKEEVKSKTKHDPQVVQLNTDYETNKIQFTEKWSSLVWHVTIGSRYYLQEFFSKN